MKTKNALLKFIVIITIYSLALYLVSTVTKSIQKNFTLNYFYFIPSIILLATLFIFLEREDLKKLKTPIKAKELIIYGLLSVVSIAFYVYILFFMPITQINKNLTFFLLLTYILLLVALLFLIIAILNLDFIRKFKRKILASSIITLFFLEFALILRENWIYLSRLIGKLTYFLLLLSGKEPRLTGLELSVRGFSVTIGAPCSGIESLSLFTAILLLLIVFDYKKFNPKRLFMAIPLGYIGIFAILVLRIYSLTLIGIINPHIAINAYHNNIGWILFSAYTVLFFYFAYPNIKR